MICFIPYLISSSPQSCEVGTVIIFTDEETGSGNVMQDHTIHI